MFSFGLGRTGRRTERWLCLVCVGTVANGWYRLSIPEPGWTRRHSVHTASDHLTGGFSEDLVALEALDKAGP